MSALYFRLFLGYIFHVSCSIFLTHFYLIFVIPRTVLVRNLQPTFPDIYLYQIGKFMYLFKKGLLPNYFQDMFILALSQVHSYNTRNSNRKFYIFPFRTNFRKFSIRFQGPKFFNSLNQEIQDVKVLVCLPKDLKRSFLFSHINPFKELHTCFLLVCFIVTFLKKIPNNIFTYSVPEIYCLSYIGSQEAYSP